jgi:integrase
MKRSGIGDYYTRLEARGTEKLDPELKLCWLNACSRKIVRALPFKHKAAHVTYLSLARQKPSSRTIPLLVLNELVAVATTRKIFTGDIRDVVDPIIMNSIFDKEWAHLKGRTRWNRCRALWRLMWELYEVDAGWLLIGGRRFRLKDDSVIHNIDPDLIHRLEQVAEAMAKDALAGVRSGDRASAVKLRTAAHMCLMAFLAGRLSEIALMKRSQMIEEGLRMIALVDGAHSKMGDHGRDPVKPEAAEIIRQYIEHARPLLLGPGVDGKDRALWITVDGLDAEAGGMAAALRQATLGLVPGGISASDIRRSALSQPGQTLEEKARKARHVRGSATAPINYAKRDRGSALRVSTDLSAIEPNDLPAAMLPEARSKARRAAERASNRSKGKRRK